MHPALALMAGLLLTSSPVAAHAEDPLSRLLDAPRDPRVYLDPPEDRYLLLRIGLETTAGVLVYFGGAVAGVYVTAWAYCKFGGGVQCGQAGLNIYSMVAGAVAAVTLAEWGVGTLLGGLGGILPTLAGALLGAAIGIPPFGPSAPLAFLLVPVGATVGYEVSNHLAWRERLPAVALFPVQGGGGLAFAWRI